MDQYNNSDAIRSYSIGSVLTNTFFRMFLGLLASGITALYTYHSGLYLTLLSNGYFTILAIAELIVVLVFSFLFSKLSSNAVTILFYAYAFLNGFTLSVIFPAFGLTTVAYAFIATSVLFAVLAFIGKKTDKDISNWGTVLTVSLVIGLIVTIVNIFLKSSVLDILLNWAILFIFFGLTIYDTNKIKLMQESGAYEEDKLYVYGAMQLYLDFINIFLRVLRILGNRKR